MARTSKKKTKTKSTGIDLSFARRVIAAEAKAVSSQKKIVDKTFRQAAEIILALNNGSKSGGRLIVTGMGKAGLIGRKIAATFASTGTPSLFLHPTEAVHGDLGIVTKRDVVLALSNSGSSEEVMRLIPILKKIKITLLAIVGSVKSPLGKEADASLVIGKISEPCPLRMAPSASTAAMLAVGDALALTVLEARGFSTEDFVKLHPGGALGRKLLRAKDRMRTGHRLQFTSENITIKEAASRITKAKSGAIIVVDKGRRLKGIFTDGDFRRLMMKKSDTLQHPLRKHMIRNCRSVHAETLIAEVQELMSNSRINSLPVVDDKKRVVGLLDIQDLVDWPVL